MADLVESGSVQESYGNDAVMFLTDLNILCGEQAHWVLLNNAFQASDPTKYPIGDRELSLIYDFIALLMNINETSEMWRAIKERETQSSSKRCGNCQKSGESLLRCSRCKSTYYCDVQCQRSDWKTHKKTCRN